jgi:hypothetical protein
MVVDVVALMSYIIFHETSAKAEKNYWKEQL